MCEQGYKVHKSCDGLSRTGQAPASQKILPVDVGKSRGYNKDAGNIASGPEREGARSCDGADDRENRAEVYRRAIEELIRQIGSLDYLCRIYNLAQYLYDKRK